jgi:hypothetical protein
MEWFARKCYLQWKYNENQWRLEEYHFYTVVQLSYNPGWDCELGYICYAENPPSYFHQIDKLYKVTISSLTQTLLEAEQSIHIYWLEYYLCLD